jgi:hypothetical protein
MPHGDNSAAAEKGIIEKILAKISGAQEVNLGEIRKFTVHL